MERSLMVGSNLENCREVTLYRVRFSGAPPYINKSRGRTQMARRVKQVIVVRKDLNMTHGKMAAQVSHASMGSLFKIMNIGKFSNREQEDLWAILICDEKSYLNRWLNESFVKVVLEVNSEEEMIELIKSLTAQDEIAYSVIEDEGRTEFNNKPTLTCVGIGPYWSDGIDNFTGNLKLYKV